MAGKIAFVSILLLLLFTPTQALAFTFPKPPKIPTPPPVPTAPKIHCPKNPLFPCRTEVQQMIDKALKPIQSTITDIQNELASIQNSFTQLNGTVNTTVNKQKSDEKTIQTQADEIQSLQDTVASQDAKITALEDSSNPPQLITVFTFQQLTNGEQSDIFTISNRRQIVMDGESQNGTGGFDLQYSDDKSSWTDEGGITVASGLWNEHVQRSFPVEGKYYKVKIINGFQGWLNLELY